MAGQFGNNGTVSKSVVLQASMGYTKSGSVNCFDDLASVFKETNELDGHVLINCDELPCWSSG